MQCQAKSKQSGNQCKLKAVDGFKVCRFHGGLTPVGVASPHYKHGRYSKHLPQHLLEKYQQALDDKDLLNLRDEIALTDAKLAEQLGQLETQGGTQDWKQVQNLWNVLLEANRAGDQDDIRMALRNMDSAINTGVENIALWNSIERTIENRRRLVQTEAKRLTDMGQVIVAERAMTLVFALIDIIQRRLVPYRDNQKPVDNSLLSGISSDIRALTVMNKGE